MRRHAKTENGQLQMKADRLLQQVFTKLFTHCEMCGQPVSCAHHFIEKSKSNILRYDFKNLVPVCQSCHTKFHNKFGFSKGTYDIIDALIRKRGKKWLNYIEKTRHKIIKTDKIWYNAIINSLEKEINEKTI